LLCIQNVTFFNFQYDDCRSELERMNKNFPDRLINFPDLDQMNDLDSVAALLSCMDYVITPNTTVALLAGGLGIKTWLLTPTVVNKYWGRQTECDEDYWFGSIRYITGNGAGDKKGLIQKTIESLYLVAGNESERLSLSYLQLINMT